MSDESERETGDILIFAAHRGDVDTPRKDINDENRDEGQGEASDIKDDDSKVKPRVETTIHEEGSGSLVQPRYSKVRPKEDCTRSAPGHEDPIVYVQEHLETAHPLDSNSAVRGTVANTSKESAQQH